MRVVAGLLRRDGRVLLCHRRSDRTSYPDVWDLPGGHVDRSERIADTLVRELAEELGVAVAIPKEKAWVTVAVDGIELSIYLVDRWRGEPHNAAPDEHDDLRWFAAGDLADLSLAHPAYLDLLTTALATGDGRAPASS